jgi:histidine triad (HIT) family protein
MATIFSKIIKRELPAEIIFENDRIIAFKDIYPKAPVHILIVTKKEIPSLQAVKPEDLALIGEVVEVAQKLAIQYKIDDGYRLITNNGSAAGQSVFHLHFHLLGGRQLGDL